ncbi:hypothetical protein BZA05DRAFT_458607 [Tricharina praecox]|uniref:uncharacterized protein n=1 Tax=Tricharina praecox TaxID=43433 RepID=UPI00221E6097|nr:uncharacterized protein BZA05DRAFT_458607 [Tricharina praecox]KAI5846191.1 hypothetical protein BZA05DRAFT_458607 [Tricharina praecox]
MPRPSSGTRKEAAFVVLSVCVITIFSIFILAAAKIGRELKARIVVFWAILLTTALAILSLLYLTVLVAYYRPLSRHGSTAVLTFILGVAWAVATVAEIMDPNNTFPSRKARVQQSGHVGESELNFRARVALSGITAFLLLVLALFGGLRVLGITGTGTGRGAGERDMEMRSQVTTTTTTPSPEPSPSEQPSATSRRSAIMGALARVGIIKDRTATMERAIP